MISEALIEQVKENQRPYVRLDRKYIHIKEVQQAWLCVFGQHPRKVNGCTVGYEEDAKGNLKIAVVFKHPNDCYNKKIGRDIVNMVLNTANQKQTYNIWTKTPEGFVITVDSDTIFATIPVVSQVLQMNDIKNVYLKSSIVLPEIQSFVSQFISEKKINNPADQIWIPDLD